MDLRHQRDTWRKQAEKWEKLAKKLQTQNLLMEAQLEQECETNAGILVDVCEYWKGSRYVLVQREEYEQLREIAHEDEKYSLTEKGEQIVKKEKSRVDANQSTLQEQST